MRILAVELQLQIYEYITHMVEDFMKGAHDMAEYTIRELAVRYNMPASTLRYYEDLGLLTNVTHNEKNQRIYNDSHIATLNAIQCFKQTGLPLGKMKEFFEYAEDLEEHIDEVVDMMVEHEADIKRQMQELQDGLDHIQHKVRFYLGIKKAIENKTPWPRWEDL